MNQTKPISRGLRVAVSLVGLALLALGGCARMPEATRAQEAVGSLDAPGAATVPAELPQNLGLADVLSVQVSGSPGAYQFSVEIRSPDTGCEQYADWWEVLDERGNLLYRRNLAHSHTNEQPFVRSGGPVPVEADTPIWVRAHMHPGGYGGAVYRGSVADGLVVAELDAGFADEVADQPPVPGGCAF